MKFRAYHPAFKIAAGLLLVRTLLAVLLPQGMPLSEFLSRFCMGLGLVFIIRGFLGTARKKACLFMPRTRW